MAGQKTGDLQQLHQKEDEVDEQHSERATMRVQFVYVLGRDSIDAVVPARSPIPSSDDGDRIPAAVECLNGDPTAPFLEWRHRDIPSP